MTEDMLFGSVLLMEAAAFLVVQIIEDGAQAFEGLLVHRLGGELGKLRRERSEKLCALAPAREQVSNKLPAHFLDGSEARGNSVVVSLQRLRDNGASPCTSFYLER